MDLGFKGGFKFGGRNYSQQQFEIVWSNEINPSACATYRRNLDGNIIEGDIWKNLNKLPKVADVVIGGFPCQDISVNGKGVGTSGSRSGLYRAMVEVVRRIKPKIFVAENVKGLLSKKHAKDRAQIIEDFSSLGYDVEMHLLMAADYGVPQTRERVIIVGTLPGERKFNTPAMTHISVNHISAKTTLKDLEEVKEDPAFAHIWSRAKRSPEQGDRRLLPDRPGYTIRAECHGNIQWHYSLPRRISMREAARIQSFPDSFVFPAGIRETERQIGNAVPPVLGWHIAKATAKALKND